jgi:HEAT repeat protein
MYIDSVARYIGILALLHWAWMEESAAQSAPSHESTQREPITVENVIVVFSADDMCDPELGQLSKRISAAGTNILPVLTQALTKNVDSWGAHNMLRFACTLPGDKSSLLPSIRQLARRQGGAQSDAIEALGTIGSGEDVPLFLDELSAGVDWQARIAAAVALSKLGDGPTADQMEQVLRDKESNRRRAQHPEEPGLEAQFTALKDLKTRLLRERIAKEADEGERQKLEQELALLLQQPAIPVDIRGAGDRSKKTGE